MQLIDTHTHIYLPDFDADRNEMIRRAMELGVERFYLPNIDAESVDAMLQLETDYPGTCYAMMGLHPCSVNENWKASLQWVESRLHQRPFAGVGEVGLDYYWDKSFVQEQKESFSMQVEWARSLQIPVVIHSRDALGDCIDIIRQFQDGRLKGVFHCYSGSAEDAKRITGSPIKMRGWVPCWTMFHLNILCSRPMLLISLPFLIVASEMSRLTLHW